MGAKILVADDSITIQTAVQLTLGRENVELIPARSGEEAIRKGKEVTPDLMLIDTAMPDTSGYEVCRILKADPAMRDVPVIMLTGPSDAADRPEGGPVGASDFIAKPFESQTLIKKVKQLLDARPVHLSTPSHLELEMAAMEVGPDRPQIEETRPLLLEKELALAGPLAPPAVPPPLTARESPSPPSEKPLAPSLANPGALSVEIPQQLLERAVTEAAEQAVSRVTKEVMEKLVGRIEQIVREVVPTLAESLIAKEIEQIKASIPDKSVD